MPVYGTVSPDFEAVRDAFATAQSTDAGGAQLAVYQHGVKVVDLWTGNDPVRGRPFSGEDYVLFMSCTKGLTALVANILVQRGLLDVDLPVSTYWPEFAKNGKEKITTRMFLTHSAGLGAIPAEYGMKVSDMANWGKHIHWLEEMAPFWEPGTKCMYHPYTFGFLVGEVVRRITGKTIGTLFHEEIAVPYGLDLWIGLPEDKEPRVIPWMTKTPLNLPADPTLKEAAAPSGGFPQVELSKSPLMAAYMTVYDEPSIAEFMATRAAHESEIPAANGIGDARSLAKLYAHIMGEVDGKPPLLRAETLKLAITEQTERLPMPSPFDQMTPPGSLRFGLGFAKDGLLMPMFGESSFGHAGAGGRMAFGDIDSGITVGYVCNNSVWDGRSGPDPRWVPWLDALRHIAKTQSH